MTQGGQYRVRHGLPPVDIYRLGARNALRIPPCCFSTFPAYKWHRRGSGREPNSQTTRSCGDGCRRPTRVEQSTESPRSVVLDVCSKAKACAMNNNSTAPYNPTARLAKAVSPIYSPDGLDADIPISECRLPSLDRLPDNLVLETPSRMRSTTG